MFSLPLRAKHTTTRFLPHRTPNISHTSPLSTLASTTHLTPTQHTIRTTILSLCNTSFPPSYWRTHDTTGTYPSSFHAALARDGWLGIALPPQYGGSGLGITEATVMMQAISESGAGMAGAQAVHGNVYATQALLWHGKEGDGGWLEEVVRDVVSGQERVCFGVTEPGSGLDTLNLRTFAEKINGTAETEGDEVESEYYGISGSKIWITCAQVASRMILLARTKAREEVSRPKDALSLFCIPLPASKPVPGLDIRRIDKMGACAIDANEVFFDDYRVPAHCLVGEQGTGFTTILRGMNAERCLLAGEALGLGYAALAKAAAYAKDRVVFGRPIGMNQGIAHPLADAWMRLEAAQLATYHAARLYDSCLKHAAGSNAGSSTTTTAVTLKDVGIAANTAKYLAAEAAFAACERAVLAHGGMGYAREYDVERFLRESLIPRIAPVSREMVLNFVGEKVLGLPRSY